jgi:hypothetical protein
MSSMGAVAVWGPVSQQARGEVRLTRRGRLARSLAMLVVMIAVAALVAGRVVGEPVRAEAAAAAPVATASVVVEQGDSLWAIAERHVPNRDPRDVIHEVRELNGLRSNVIQPGQVLLVPSEL